MTFLIKPNSDQIHKLDIFVQIPRDAMLWMLRIEPINNTARISKAKDDDQ